MQVIMSVAGFLDALRSTVSIELKANVVVNVASLPAIALLKIMVDFRTQQTALLPRKSQSLNLQGVISHFMIHIGVALFIVSHCNYYVAQRRISR